MSSVAIVGAGRIGVPWGAVLASQFDHEVTCIDIDPDRVDQISRGEAPFSEPNLGSYLGEAVESGRLRATTDPSVVADHRYVALTVNAPRNGMSRYLDTVREYATHLDDDHVVVSRVTLPVDMLARTHDILQETADGSPTFTVLPERLAEGHAIEEIERLPKIVGVFNEEGKYAMRQLLDGFGCETRFTDPETAMFVKLIDNTYRDALFAIANQIAFTADELGLDAREAIELANYEYPRNDIPIPGPVGGKCLPKDPHFLTDERVCDQPTTPDLFNATRRTNASIPAYVVTSVLRRQPSKVAVLGLSYKRGVGDSYNSPAADVVDRLQSQGVTVETHDPHLPDETGDFDGTLSGADVVVLAVNHPEFEGIESAINDRSASTAVVYDLWGALDEDALRRPYDGFGIASVESGNDRSRSRTVDGTLSTGDSG